LLATGHSLPPLRPLLNAALIGILLLAVGNGFVTLAEHQHVPSGIAAVMVATVPLFTLCFSRFLVSPPARLSGWGLLLVWRASFCLTAAGI
jgi:drug/metabolite transporter (DMT)-like permease